MAAHNNRGLGKLLKHVLKADECPYDYSKAKLVKRRKTKDHIKPATTMGTAMDSCPSLQVFSTDTTTIREEAGLNSVNSIHSKV